MNIPFNKPYMTGAETDYIRQAVESGKISGNGIFTKKCQSSRNKSVRRDDNFIPWFQFTQHSTHL